ncbi:MAG: SIMPL domain-containing protein [Gammaproteobacteria bacterium]|nr:SIMPL domain-containing protein [Gammaproteobacteria bacterium]
MEIVGYHVSRRLKVELLDISQFATLVAEIAKLDNVSSLDADFDVTNRDSVELKLMNEAGVDARRIAENMVHGMSRTVGRVFAISKSSIRSSVATFAFDVRANYPAAMMRMSADYQETIFEPSTIELRQSIHVMFELE